MAEDAGSRRRIRHIGAGEIGRGKPSKGRKSVEEAVLNASQYNSDSDDDAPAGKENSNSNASVLGALKAQEKRQGEAKRKAFPEPDVEKDIEKELFIEHKPVVRRRVMQKSRSHIGQVEEAKEGAAGEGTSPDKEDLARVRPRAPASGTGAAGRPGATKKSGKKSADSGDEYDPADEELERWQRDLNTRQGSTEDPRSAFSLKPVSPQEMRLLSPDCFLGGKKNDKPLFNFEGKVSLQFLLSTYRSGEKLREKRGKEPGESEADRAFLRWLVTKARELSLVGSKEIRSGAIAKRRLEHCKQNGNWALIEANLAEASDEESLLKQKAAAEKANQMKALGVTQLDVEFPTARRVRASDSDAKGAKLKSHVTERKENINVASSHGVDLQKMRDVLTAPSLSFDWSQQEAEEEEDNLADGLDVDVPDMISKAEAKRNLWRDQLKRSVSFNQAKSLAKLDRKDSDASLASEQTSSQDKPSGKVKAARALFQEDKKSEKKKKSMEEVPVAETAKVPELETRSSDLWNRISARASPTKPEASESIAAEVKPTSKPSAPQDVLKSEKDVPESGKDFAQPKKDVPQSEKDVQPQSDKDMPKPDEMMTQKEDNSLEPDGDSLEISPTLPFKPILGNLEDLEISPTLPFVPVVEEAVPVPAEPAEDVGEEAPAVQEPKTRAKRPAAVTEDTESSDEELAGLEQEGVEVTKDDLERLRREREWHRHKRRALRKEIQNQALAQSKERSSQREAKLAAVMSDEDRKRFEAVVSGNSSGKSSGVADDDFMVPQRRTGSKKSSFLGAKKSL